MLVITAACGRRLDRVSSWKEETSTTAISSKPSFSTSPTSGLPTLPHSTEFLPAALKISCIIDTVVVLPLVPVTATAAARRYSAPSSSSPIMHLPCLRNDTGRELSMGMPGLKTSTSHKLTALSRPSASTRCAPSSSSEEMTAEILSLITSSYR